MADIPDLRSDLTPEEIEAAQARYDAVIDRLLNTVVHVLHCELGLNRMSAANALICAAGRLAVGHPEVAESIRVVSSAILDELTKAGHLSRPN